MDILAFFYFLKSTLPFFIYFYCPDILSLSFWIHILTKLFSKLRLLWWIFLCFELCFLSPLGSLSSLESHFFLACFSPLLFVFCFAIVCLHFCHGIFFHIVQNWVILFRLFLCVILCEYTHDSSWYSWTMFLLPF